MLRLNLGDDQGTSYVPTDGVAAMERLQAFKRAGRASASGKQTIGKPSETSKRGLIGPVDPYSEEACLRHIRHLVETDGVLFGPHALDAMEQEVPRFTVEDVCEGLRTGQVLENYPEAARGPCCLVNGRTGQGRPVHVVCTTTRTPLFIVTVYEPKPPKFITPSQRGRR